LSAYRADRAGNVQFRGGSANFNTAFAKAARVAIVEVEEIVEVGELPPELIDLPGIFISRVLKITDPIDVKTLTRAEKRPADSARTYNGKQALTRNGIAKMQLRLCAMIPMSTWALASRLKYRIILGDEAFGCMLKTACWGTAELSLAML